MHDEVRGWVSEQIVGLDPKTVVEFGSLDVNGTIRDLFDCEYVGVDVVDGPNVDLVADAATVDLKADLIVCCEVLEHHPAPWSIIENAKRCLNPGGTFILTCAGISRTAHGQHGDPDVKPGEWYRNIDRISLREWLQAEFADFRIEVRRHGADLLAVAR